MTEARTTNAEILNRIETVDSRLAKVQSDVNDLKVNGARDNERIDQIYRVIEKLERKLWGGDGGGLVAEVQANTDMRERIDKLFWLVIAEAIGLGFMLIITIVQQITLNKLGG